MEKRISVANEETLENSINLEQLTKLKKAFDQNDCGTGALGMDEFLKAFDSVFGKGKKLAGRDLEILFQRIDANANGEVDWEEFSMYLLMGDEHKRSLEEQKKAFDIVPLETKNRTNHPDMILSMCVGCESRDVITSSRDCVVRFWSRDDLTGFYPSGSLSFGNTLPSSMTMSHDSKTLLIATMNRDIHFVDASSRKLERSFRGERRMSTVGLRGSKATPLMGLSSIPMAATFLYHPTKTVTALGLDSGDLSLLELPEDKNGKHSYRPVMKLHKEWITGLRSTKNNDNLVSSSLDGTIKLTYLENQRTVTTLYGHKKGVRSFDWNYENKLLTSCGFDREVLIWNPFIAAPLARISGHSAPLVQVALNKNCDLIFSLSSDKMIKIWDIRMYKCVKTIQDTHKHAPDDELTSMTYDKETGFLYAGGSSIRAWQLTSYDSAPRETWESNPNRKLFTCAQQIVGFAFNKFFGQAITASSTMIMVWNALTGKKLINFAAPYRITSLSLDMKGRRLITGHGNDCILVWNYMNGQILKECRGLSGRGDMEINVALHIQLPTSPPIRYFVGAGWGKRIMFWEDTEQPNSSPDENHIFERQENDILDVTYWGGADIATSSEKGEILVYNVNSGTITSRLDVMHEDENEDTCAEKDLGKEEEHSEFIHSGVIQKRLRIECLLFLKKYRVLVGGGGDGKIRFIDVSSSNQLFCLAASHIEGETISSIATDEKETVLVAGDTAGFLSLFSIAMLERSQRKSIASALQLITCQASFRVSKRPVIKVTITTISSTMENESFLGVASDDNYVSIWTMQGDCVGIFGHSSWEIREKNTYATDISDALSEEPEESIVSPKNLNANRQRKLTVITTAPTCTLPIRSTAVESESEDSPAFNEIDEYMSQRILEEYYRNRSIKATALGSGVDCTNAESHTAVVEERMKEKHRHGCHRNVELKRYDVEKIELPRSVGRGGKPINH